MAEIKNPPSLSMSGISDLPQKNVATSQLWKKYFEQQEVIQTISDQSAIKKIISTAWISLPQADSEITFAILFPKSFMHLNDYLNNLPKAVAFAAFLSDGNVILKITDDQQNVDYLDAWKEIVSRTTGATSLHLIPPIVQKDIGTIEEIMIAHENYKKNLQNIVDAFNRIPGVEAIVYKDDNPDRLIEIDIQTAPPVRGHDTIEGWEVDLLGNVDSYYEDGNEVSAVYKEWEEKVSATNPLTVQKFYDYVVELSKMYATVPDFQS